jgi:hypothetical protein
VASYRSPKGALGRTVPDWNSANLAYTGLFSGGGGFGSANLGLFNNDPQGRFFVVWDCTISIGPQTAGGAFTGNAVWEVANAPVTGFTSPCAAVNPMATAPSGLVASAYNLGALDPNRGLYSALAGPGTWVWPHDWPMAIVPVGYSLIVEFGWNNANVNFGVVFEMTASL